MAKIDAIEFKKFIKQRDVVIADVGPTTRAMLATSMNGLGVMGSHLHPVSTYDEASELIGKLAPQIVITDFDLGPDCGLNLLQDQRESNPECKDSLFIIITANTSQTAVAQAAEEDVDAYILKPFTLESLKHSLIGAVKSRIHPSDYIRTIGQGKTLLFSGNIDGAMTRFSEAIALNPVPALAYFYRAQAGLMQNALKAAEADFKTGLDINKMHYKCLVGLFDLLISQKRDEEAYTVVKKIATYFPSHPKRLTQILKLTISLKKIDDLLEYYGAFCNLNRRDENLVTNMCAALVVAGKYFFQKKETARALELLKKATVSAAGNPKILKEVILTLTEYDQSEEARTVLLQRFTPLEMESSNYAVSDIAIKLKTLSPQMIVKEIKDWFDKGVYDPWLYDQIIRKLIENKSISMAQDFFYLAQKQYPLDVFLPGHYPELNPFLK